MNDDKIVQFVSFDTILDNEQFINKWQEYTRSANIDNDVTIQQSAREKGFKYVVQHRCAPGELHFIFEKSRRSSRIREVAITATLAGGYSILQSDRSSDVSKGETKIFAFLPDTPVNLKIYQQLSLHSELNIYEAYYENCKYAYILEFFVKNKYVATLLELLKQHDNLDLGVYKKCSLRSDH